MAYRRENNSSFFYKFGLLGKRSEYLNIGLNSGISKV